MKKILIVLGILLVIGLLFVGVLVGVALKDVKEMKDNAAGVGDAAPDFTVETVDGEKFTLSETLKEKDLVLINIFTTWCGPCEREFPELESAYEKYKDRIEIIALCDEGQSEEMNAKIREYRDSHGLTFPVAAAGPETEKYFPGGYPTSYIIDREGNIVFMQAGYFYSEEALDTVLDAVLADDYKSHPVALYTFMAANKDHEVVPGVTFTISSDTVNETLTTKEDGFTYYFTDAPEELTVKIESVPDGYKIKAGKELKVGPASGWLTMQVEKQ